MELNALGTEKAARIVLIMLRVHYINSFTSNKDSVDTKSEGWVRKMQGPTHWPAVQREGGGLASVAR